MKSIFSIVALYTLYITIKESINYYQVKNIDRKLINDDSYAESFAQNLDVLIHKEPFLKSFMEKLPIVNGLVLDDYKIILYKEISSQISIIHVLKKDIDFMKGGFWNTKTIEIRYELYFRIEITNDNYIKISSNLFSERYDKDLRNRFVTELMKHLKS